MLMWSTANKSAQPDSPYRTATQRKRTYHSSHSFNFHYAYDLLRRRFGNGVAYLEIPRILPELKRLRRIRTVARAGSALGIVAESERGATTLSHSTKSTIHKTEDSLPNRHLKPRL